jgi:hydrogenase maturation protease
VTEPLAPLAVIGVGNVLRGDDAVGIHAVEGLRAAAERDRRLLPARTLLVDGGTLGLDLLRTIREAGAVVFVDAAHLGAVPGTVRVLRGEDLIGAAAAPAGEAGAVGELVAVARVLGWLPEDVSLVAIEAGDVTPGLALSPPVGAAVERAMQAVRTELWRMNGRLAGDAENPRLASGMAGATA